MGTAILVCSVESKEWVGAGLPLRISGRCGRHMRESTLHVGPKLRATPAQRVKGMNGSRGHDDAVNKVPKVQQKVMRSERGLTQKSL